MTDNLMVHVQQVLDAGAAYAKHKGSVNQDLTDYYMYKARQVLDAVSLNSCIMVDLRTGHKETPDRPRLALDGTTMPPGVILGALCDLDEMSRSLEAIFDVPAPRKILQQAQGLHELILLLELSESALTTYVRALYNEHVHRRVSERKREEPHTVVTQPPAPEALVVNADREFSGERKPIMHLGFPRMDRGSTTATNPSVDLEIYSEAELIEFFEAVNRATTVAASVAKLTLRTAERVIKAKRSTKARRFKQVEDVIEKLQGKRVTPPVDQG